MRHLARAAAAGALCVAVAAGAATSGAEEVVLGLDEAVQRAIAANLDLRARGYTPAISETAVRSASALYDPTLKALLDHIGEVSPRDTSTDMGDLNRAYDANVSVDRLLPTGGTLSGGFSNVWRQSTPSTSASNFQEPKLAVTFSQPLLQGRGREVTERELTTARNNRDVAVAGWRGAALNTAAGARDQYFGLVKARQNLETRRTSLAVAERVHLENQARVRQGVLAAVELLDSELGVEARQIELLGAEQAVKDQSEQLRVFLQLPAGRDLSPEPAFTAESESRPDEDLVAEALRRRPELVQARILLKTLELDERVAQNSLLPSVAATGSAGLLGYGRDYSDASSDVGELRYPFWSVGLNLTYTLGNNVAESELTASRLRIRQAKTSLLSQEQSVALEVESALRRLVTRRKQIEVAEKGVTLAETRLASFLKRQKVGIATTKDVLEAERDLTTAREALSAGKADYESALTQLWKSTGELLERHGIRIDDAEVTGMVWKEAP